MDRLLGPLLKTSLPLMTNILKPLAKSVLIPLGLTAAAAATDAAIQKKIFESGMTTLIISNDKMDNVKCQIVTSLEGAGLLIKGVSEKMKNEAKEQKEWFLGVLLRTFGAGLLGTLLKCKGVVITGEAAIVAG